MFKTGDLIRITLKENGIVEAWNVRVLDCDDGLLKVDRNGEISVINMRSIAFIKATHQE